MFGDLGNVSRNDNGQNWLNPEMDLPSTKYPNMFGAVFFRCPNFEP